MADSLDDLLATVTVTVQHGTGGPLWPGVVALRQRVFGDEQGIVEAGASDPEDEDSIHAIASLADDDLAPVVVAAGRVTLNHQGRNEAIIAWVATERTFRRMGIGREVMYALLDQADLAGIGETVLAAQRHAEEFYAEFGFLPTGPPYKVRGIPHRWMSRSRP
ncbi:MAG: GNAT family N-acetyltransferase [Thermomicrobiales bacterium]